MSNHSRRHFLRMLAQGGGAATVSSFLPLSLRLPPDNLLTSEVVSPGREGAEALASAAVPGSLLNSVYHFVVDPAGEGTHTTISDALVDAGPGDTIFVRNGVYQGGFAITVPGLTLIGESTRTVIVQSLADSVTPAITIAADSVSLLRFKIDGRRDLQTSAGSGDVGPQAYSGIYISNSSHLVLHQLWVYDTRGMGIAATANSNYGHISGCRVENRATDGTIPVSGSFSAGIFLQGRMTGWHINDNYVTGWSQAIGLWYGPNNCRVEHNNIVANYGYVFAGGTRSACEDYGADVLTHGRNLWFANKVDGSTSCCFEIAQGVNGSCVSNNWCTNWNRFGDGTGSAFVIADGGANQQTSNITIQENIVDGTGLAFSSGCVIGGRRSRILGNRFYNFNSAGAAPLVVQGAHENGTVIDGNRFEDCRGAVFVHSGSNSARIINNTVIRPSSRDAVFRLSFGGQHVVKGNYIIGDSSLSAPGILIEASAGIGQLVTENSLLGMGSWGIDVRTNYNRILNNHISTTNPFGCIAIQGAHYNTVKHNYCDAGGAARTIYFTGTPTHNIVTENILVGANASVFETYYWTVNSDTNQIVPNHKDTGINKTNGNPLGQQTVGTAQIAVAHGLPYAPREVRVTMTSDGQVWKSASSTTTYIYLKADADGRTCEVWVR